MVNIAWMLSVFRAFLVRIFPHEYTLFSRSAIFPFYTSSKHHNTTTLFCGAEEKHLYITLQNNVLFFFRRQETTNNKWLTFRFSSFRALFSKIINFHLSKLCMKLSYFQKFQKMQHRRCCIKFLKTNKKTPVSQFLF